MSHRLLVLELQHHVGRLLDADLILTADGDALSGALRGMVSGNSAGSEPASHHHLEQFILTLEALVEAGDLPPAEASPALAIAHKALSRSAEPGASEAWKTGRGVQAGANGSSRSY